jgi:hypothetical protein
MSLSFKFVVVPYDGQPPIRCFALKNIEGKYAKTSVGTFLRSRIIAWLTEEEGKRMEAKITELQEDYRAAVEEAHSIAKSDAFSYLEKLQDE